VTAASLLAGRGNPWPLLARHAAWIAAMAGNPRIQEGNDPMKAQSGRDTGTRKSGRKALAGPASPAAPEKPRATEPSEDFAERRDIETADEPKEQHDQRHHARDVKSVPA
jgi:hypothetical protein